MSTFSQRLRSLRKETEAVASGQSNINNQSQDDLNDRSQPFNAEDFERELGQNSEDLTDNSDLSGDESESTLDSDEPSDVGTDDDDDDIDGSKNPKNMDTSTRENQKEKRSERSKRSKEDKSSKRKESYPGVMRPDKTNVVGSKHIEDLRAKFFSKKFKLPKVKNKLFDDLPTMSTTGTSTESFDDDCLKDRVAVRLNVMNNNLKIISLGEKMLRSLKGQLTRRRIAQIFNLAYQLKAPGINSSTRVFPVIDPFRGENDIRPSDVDESVVVGIDDAEAIEYKDNYSPLQKAQMYAFIASSLLRMFTRSPENYSEAWKHINDGFETFYARPTPLKGFTPNKENLKSLHKQFSLDPLFKMTLYRILYMSSSDSDHLSLKRFLYEIHLAHTGMHIVPIFSRLCISLNCTTKTLLIGINNPEYEVQLKALVSVIRKMADNDGPCKQQMWKYGRIFDQNFMSSLQTRACPRLVYILAAALKYDHPDGSSNILSIQQLVGINERDKENCQMAGEALVRMIRSTHIDKYTSPIYQFV
ncbi:TPA_asm: nucleocapsid protein [Ranunculus virus 1]|uniref:Nucleoprotein n=1 Tax=Ranunculus virus 1 TaxID=2977983 RepID=A0A9N7AAN1_9RHAB|nr:TPA_asm: nucleocapsid protein [Ranunculus virus 1]